MTKKIKAYLEHIDCPKCGLIGDHFLILNPDTSFLYHVVLHFNRQYDAKRYAKLKKKGVPYNLRRSNASRKTKIWECYLGRY